LIGAFSFDPVSVARGGLKPSAGRLCNSFSPMAAPQTAKPGPQSLKINPMTGEDIAEVMEIEMLSFPNPWSRAQFESEIRNPVSFSYTVRTREDGRGGRERLVAYIVFWVVHGEAHVLNIAVHTDFRREGIATWLMEASLGVMRENLAYEVYLEVRRSNAAARRLYSNLGFKEVFERKNYYGDEDAIVMRYAFEELPGDEEEGL